MHPYPDLPCKRFGHKSKRSIDPNQDIELVNILLRINRIENRSIKGHKTDFILSVR